MCWPSVRARIFWGYWRSHICQSGAEVSGDSGVLCRVYCHIISFSLSRFGYWMSGSSTISHSSSVVVYQIAHINFGSKRNSAFAVSWICERICFGRDVNWSSSRYINAYQKLSQNNYCIEQCRILCACFAFDRTACWLCQQDSNNKIRNNIETLKYFKQQMECWVP